MLDPEIVREAEVAEDPGDLGQQSWAWTVK
jgi:hypothetical protein